MIFNHQIHDKITDLFAPFAKSDSPGFAVGIVQDGSFEFCQGFGQANLELFSPITSETVFDVGSMAKQFVGMAIAILEERGELSMYDKMRKYLPEFPVYTQEITLANLLYHTSGIRNYTVLAYYMMGYHESDAITKDEVYALLLRLRSLNFSPGERWEYSDSNYFLLAKIIEKITGQSLHEYSSEAIFQPLGMQNTLFRESHSQVIKNRAISYVTHPIMFDSPYKYRHQQDPSDTFHTLISNYEHIGAEGLFTTLSDLFTWGQNFLNNRLEKGQSHLTERVLTPGVQINEEVGYGFGLNVGKFRGKRFFGHDGAIHGYTSSMMNFPDENVSIICLTNQNKLSAWECRNRIMEVIFPENEQTVSSDQVSQPRVLDMAEQRIIGQYQNPETASIWEITCRDQRLFIQENNQWEFEIEYLEPLKYRTVHSDMDLKFEQDSEGSISVIKGFAKGKPFEFIPYLQTPLEIDDLMEYVGEYRSDELDTAFTISVIYQNLTLRNKNRHLCSMDLLYDPTIKDNFIAFDPHPISSQISFLRKKGRIIAFVYRDYDGDGRDL
jgi:CubicO group peptidase (beta-lactamase class C family)